MSRAYGVICAAVVLFQCVLQAAVFPWSALEGPRRLNNIDAPYHLYQLYLAREFCEEREVVGYDSRFAAGYVGGVTLNASAKLPALIACLAPSAVSGEAIYKAVSFWSGVFAPSLLVLACAILGLSPATGALTGLMGILLWWTGALRWYHTAGMVSYVFVAYVVPLFVATMIRWSERISATRLVLLGVMAAVSFFVHPLFPVAATLLGACWLLVDTAQRRNWVSRMAALAVVSTLMVAANWVWLRPTITVPSVASAEAPYQREVDPLLFLHELTGTASTAAGGSRLYLSLLIGAGLALAFVKGPRRGVLVGMLAGAVLLMGWASVAALSPKLALLQPNRFSALAWLAFVIPAALGIVSAAAWLRHRRSAAAVVVAGTLVVTLLPIAYYVRETIHEAYAPPTAPRYGVRAPEVRGRGAIEDELVAFLRSAPPGRVLLENSLGRVHDGGHIAGMVALRSGRELIGGPYPFLGSPSAWDGHAFGSDLESLGSGRLAGHLDSYGVRWLICHTVACKASAEALPNARLDRQIGPVAVFDRGQTFGIVLAGGTAAVTASCGNRVELEGVTGSRIVLRYQWVHGLVAHPGGRVEPVLVDRDLPPFVAIVDPPPRLLLRIGSGPGIPCAERRSVTRDATEGG